jgi:hypothetical protein
MLWLQQLTRVSAGGVHQSACRKNGTYVLGHAYDKPIFRDTVATPSNVLRASTQVGHPPPRMLLQERTGGCNDGMIGVGKLRVRNQWPHVHQGLYVVGVNA